MAGFNIERVAGAPSSLILPAPKRIFIGKFQLAVKKVCIHSVNPGVKRMVNHDALWAILSGNFNILQVDT